ncbi:MAG: guanylate kinase [Spiroplasma sp. WSS]|uniref:guanylate kinase n=1 Tax=unclassified Spiroplasma TaxID=2637901 RepID=UPI00120501D6|nr:guanylate kinase [Spiroplasma endosymbiont of Lariophagus distinguendus]TLF26649.1 MAG: guanylate kinase [Spiroplasma sp. WSS]
MAQKKGKLIILSGPSGVGKGAIIAKLFADKSLNLAYSVSMTTRKPRNKEQDGINYFFVDVSTFLNHVKGNDFLEYTNFIGNYYGTNKSYVLNLQNQGYNVILEIEVDGASQVLKNYEHRNDIMSIFIMPPSYQELEQRIRMRASESEAIIEKRLNKAKEEFKVQHEYDYIVINDDLDIAVKEITDIIKNNIN